MTTLCLLSGPYTVVKLEMYNELITRFLDFKYHLINFYSKIICNPDN